MKKKSLFNKYSQYQVIAISNTNTDRYILRNLVGI